MTPDALPQAQSGSADDAAMGFVLAALLMLFSLACYFLPSLIAQHRKHASLMAVFLVNLALGWTVIGWFVALFWSFTNDSPRSGPAAAPGPAGVAASDFRRAAKGGGIIVAAGWFALLLYLLYSAGSRGAASGKPDLSQTSMIPAARICDTSRISLSKLRAVRERFGYIRITGLVTNGCAIALGPQLKVTSYGNSGEILRVSDIWPASISNIPAHSDYPFEWLDEIPGFSTYSVRVIAFEQWGGQR